MPTIPYVATSYSASVSAAQLNNAEAGITNVSYAPAVRVTHNATQSITNAVETSLAFNTEQFDQAGNAADTQHDNVTNNSRLTCRYAGVYFIAAQAEWASNPANAQIQIRLNSTTYIASSVINVDYRRMYISTIYALAVNDFVEVRVTQGSAGAININTASAYTPHFMMVRVG